MHCELLEKVGVLGYLCIPSITVDSLKQVVLFVVVGGKDDEVDDTLENLERY